jgi:hypothetical protein
MAVLGYAGLCEAMRGYVLFVYHTLRAIVVSQCSGYN